MSVVFEEGQDPASGVLEVVGARVGSPVVIGVLVAFVPILGLIAYSGVSQSGTVSLFLPTAWLAAAVAYYLWSETRRIELKVAGSVVQIRVDTYLRSRTVAWRLNEDGLALEGRVWSWGGFRWVLGSETVRLPSLLPEEARAVTKRVNGWLSARATQIVPGDGPPAGVPW